MVLGSDMLCYGRMSKPFPMLLLVLSFIIPFDKIGLLTQLPPGHGQ